jgi:hypothetical protein
MKYIKLLCCKCNQSFCTSFHGLKQILALGIEVLHLNLFSRHKWHQYLVTSNQQMQQQIDIISNNQFPSKNFDHDYWMVRLYGPKVK